MYSKLDHDVTIVQKRTITIATVSGVLTTIILVFVDHVKWVKARLRF